MRDGGISSGALRLRGGMGSSKHVLGKRGLASRDAVGLFIRARGMDIFDLVVCDLPGWFLLVRDCLGRLFAL